MRLIKGNKLFEDYLDDVEVDDLSRDAEVTIDDRATVATHTIVINVNSISSTCYQRKSTNIFKEAMKKFDTLLRKVLERFPQFIEIGESRYDMNVNKDAMFEYDEWSGLMIKSGVQYIENCASFTAYVDVVLKVNGAAFIGFIMNLWNAFNICAQKAFPGSKTAKYGIDPIDKTKMHGMMMWKDKADNIANRKNDKATKNFVRNFMLQITGGYDNRIIDRYFNENEFDPQIYEILKKVALKANEVIISESDGGVYFIHIPKDVTLSIRNYYPIQNIYDLMKKMNKKVFFTIDGTLKINVYKPSDEYIRSFMDNYCAKNIGKVNIYIECPYCDDDFDFKRNYLLDFSMFYIDELYVRFAKANGFYANGHMNYPPYKQPKIIMNKSSKPNLVKISDPNKK